MKRNVSVVCVFSAPNILISGKIIKEMPGSVASGTPCMIKNVYCPSRKVPVFLVRFLMKLEFFSADCRKILKYQI